MPIDFCKIVAIIKLIERESASRVESGNKEKETSPLGISVQNAILVALSTKYRDNQSGSFFYFHKEKI